MIRISLTRVSIATTRYAMCRRLTGREADAQFVGGLSWLQKVFIFRSRMRTPECLRHLAANPILSVRFDQARE